MSDNRIVPLCGLKFVDEFVYASVSAKFEFPFSNQLAIQQIIKCTVQHQNKGQQMSLAR